MKPKRQEGILDVIKLIIIIFILTVLSAVIYSKYIVNKISPEAKQTAIEMNKIDPSKSVREWEQIASEPLSDVQQAAAESVFSSEPTGEIEILEDDNPDDNKVTVVDEAGQEWEVELEESDGSTDEENYAEIDRMLAEAAASLDGYDEEREGTEVVLGVTEEDIQANQDTSGEDSYDEGRDYVEDPSVLVSDPNDDWGFDPHAGKTEDQLRQELEEGQNTKYRIHGT